jgi:hypothetical protein
MPIVIEHDRGSEEQYYFRRRIHAYLGKETTIVASFYCLPI